MKIVGGGSLQLVCALLIVLHMQTSIGFNSTIGDDEVRCIESERQALLAFKHGLVDEADRLSSWGSEEAKKECCEWEGVHCSNTTGHVTVLNLTAEYGFPLRGNLSPSLFELQHLIYLDLSQNDFNLSRIPESIDSLNKIQHLDLSSCNLSGSLPSQLGNLRGLQYLDLSNNQFQGLIPENLGHMTYLETLYLIFNQFEGGIPKSFGNLCKLRYLDLSGNYLDGMLPELLGNLSGCLQISLEELDLGDNMIKGPFPDVTKKFSSLRLLDFSDNQLSGTVPKSIGLLSKLEGLNIFNNYLNGTITESHFSTLSNLRDLAMSYNHLSINFSNDWNPPFQLYFIYLRSCKLGPMFPSWLKAQRNYFYLDISENEISSSIPEWFWDQSSRIVHVDLSSNYIYGTLPDLSTKFFDSFGLGIDLSKNKLEGLLPVFPINVTSINLSENRFFESISSLCTITGGKLKLLDVSHNQLFGEFPDCITQWPTLEILNLANNNLFGKIPSSIGSLSYLESLGLQNNKFSGKIPWSLGNCSALQFLGLNNNSFSGKIPSWIGERLSSLIFLLLRSNNFSGNIPLKLCRLTEIKLLDLSNNNLFGSIPSCVQNLTTLAQKESSASDHYFIESYADAQVNIPESYVDKGSVMWKGMVRDYDNGNLKNLKLIDLSSNKLTGKIPVQISVLLELVQLNLSRNQLTGWIPSNIGQMKRLESLDLSWNQLSGQLPWSMSQLNFLSILNLSYNNFFGRIPLGTQLQTFDASSFVGNPALCGLPLTPTCPEDEKTGSKPKNKDTDEFWKSFKPSMELGAVIGFVGVLAVKLDHPWKHLCLLLFNNVRVRLSNLKDCLYVLLAAVGLLVREHVSRLGRKLKLFEPSISS